jgi:hypothetical protein
MRAAFMSNHGTTRATEEALCEVIEGAQLALVWA